MNIIKKIYYPEIFQGRHKKKHYFEGWYFKNIDKNKQAALAIIPGIAFGNKKNDAHAFIQVFNKLNNKAHYAIYDKSKFKYNKDRFEIEIDKNYFSSKEIILNIDNDSFCLQGNLIFDNIISFPKKIFRPGIMGPFSFVPFMECYHGIINIHHDIIGQIKYNGYASDFNGGYGYIEKDWGRSFPNKWIWFQSNHFDKDDATIMFSIAKVPALGKIIDGFISFLRIKDTIYYFATYTNAKLKKLEVSDKHININIYDKDYEINMNIENSICGQLKAPINGCMTRDIIESIDAIIKVSMTDKNNNVIFKGTAVNSGLEIMCDANDFCVV